MNYEEARQALKSGKKITIKGNVDVISMVGNVYLLNGKTKPQQSLGRLDQYEEVGVKKIAAKKPAAKKAPAKKATAKKKK